MKKAILFFLLLTTTFIYSQSGNILTNACWDKSTNAWGATYTDAIGKGGYRLFYVDSTFPASISILVAIQSRLDTMPKSIAPVGYVNYDAGGFTITGIGDHPPYYPALQNYSSLTTDRKAIIDSLSANILLVKGVTMTNFQTLFGSNKITINSIEYNYDDFLTIPRCALAFKNAINLAVSLYNRQ